MSMTVEQKAWMYDMQPEVKTITCHETGRLLFEVRAEHKPRSIFERLAGVGETLEEAVENAITLNGYIADWRVAEFSRGKRA